MPPEVDPHQDDLQLRGLLREWDAPATPPALAARVFAACATAPRPQPWWRFLLNGYIRVPVPVVCLLAMLLAGAVWRSAVRPPQPCAVTAATAIPQPEVPEARSLACAHGPSEVC